MQSAGDQRRAPGASALPSFPSDYSAREETLLATMKGGVMQGNDYCCLADSMMNNGEVGAFFSPLLFPVHRVPFLGSGGVFSLCV